MYMHTNCLLIKLAVISYLITQHFSIFSIYLILLEICPANRDDSGFFLGGGVTPPIPPSSFAPACMPCTFAKHRQRTQKRMFLRVAARFGNNSWSALHAHQNIGKDQKKCFPRVIFNIARQCFQFPTFRKHS